MKRLLEIMFRARAHRSKIDKQLAILTLNAQGFALKKSQQRQFFENQKLATLFNRLKRSSVQALKL